MISNAKFVHFKATDGIPLPGLLFEKQNAKNILINLHGNGITTVFQNPKKYNGLAKYVNAAGWSFLAFNNRGCGITNRIKYEKNGKIIRYWCGTSHERIEDCVKDIDGAISFLKTLGYKKFALSGFSTGANKICVYHYKKPGNQILKNLIICGADDKGLYYNEFGRTKFFKILGLCKRKIKRGEGINFMDPQIINGRCYSYQGMFDILNPEGLYNTFPFLEKLNKLNITKKKLFREIKSINSKSILIYGDKDEFCFGQVPKIIEIFKHELKKKQNFDFRIINNGDHGFTGKEKELGHIITNFLKYP